MRRPGVRLGIDRNGFEAESAAAAQDTPGDLAAIGDQNLPHWPRRHASIRATTDPSVTVSPSETRISLTFPTSGAATGISIFMDSRIRIGSSSPTVSPTLATIRSEEHTSELQSLMRISYAVFCLKKKKTT